MGKYFGTDGIRGKAERFTTDFIYAVAVGLSRYAETLNIDAPRVMLGGDTRESTEWILRDFERAFEKLGIEYGNVGVLPTPGINYAFYAMNFDFAVDVTASHNPYTDNGIKVFERGEKSGVKLSEKGVLAIENSLDDIRPVELAGGEYHTELHEDALECYTSHLESVFSEIRPAGDTDATSDLSGLKIGLDCANGATSVVAQGIFEKLGAEVAVINSSDEYSQLINRDAGSTHIEGLISLVKEKKLDYGCAFDGDGDRCLMVTGEGEVVTGDEMIAVLASWLKLPGVAATVMANQGLFDWAADTGVIVEVTDVGDQNVAKAMREKGILIGGEESGHIILPGEAMGDGVLTALVMSKVVAESGKSLKELIPMKKVPMKLLGVKADAATKKRFKQGEFAEIIENYNGKITALSGKLLVRPSGTEELIRVTVWGNEDVMALAEALTEDLQREI